MIFLNSFLIGGAICALGEIIKELFKLTNAHITGLFVFLGAFLDINNTYDRLISISGAGAMLPITSFGHLLIHGGMMRANEMGFIGLAMGMFDLTASGITSAIFFAFVFSLFMRPKD